MNSTYKKEYSIITTILSATQQQDNSNSTAPIKISFKNILLEISFKNVVYELHFFSKKNYNNKIKFFIKRVNQNFLLKDKPLKKNKEGAED
jgi:uncharacterized phage-like protein YoqJ